jgi:chromate reductase, NAD(P)H dehydrogenase (quinone)
MKLLAIPGALRQGSLNRKLLVHTVQLLEKAGAQVEWVDWKALAIPVYDGDIEAAGIPAGVLALAKQVTEVDGIVIASPEYNMSVPALIKNAIDWLSRTKPMPLRGKNALLLSASQGLVGGNRGLWALRVPLEVLGVHVYPDMFSLATAQNAFTDDGGIKEEPLAKFLNRIVDGFVKVTRAHDAVRGKA